MNKAEKKVFFLILIFLGIGSVIRFLPDKPVPVMDEFPVEEQMEFSNWEAKPSLKKELTTKKKPTKNKSKKSKTVKKAKIILPIHINKASLEELCHLKGVGPKLAEAIISYRETVGSIKNESDLKKVKGIGEKKVKSMLLDINFD